MKKQLDIIVPCYNESSNISTLFSAVTKALDEPVKNNEISLSVIFVNDGSSDNTLETIKALEKEKGSDIIKYVSFSKNFGKESALLAGFEHSTGEYVAVIDADLQHPPALLKEMYDKITTLDCDCIGTKRASRKNESPVRAFYSRNFYKVINSISNVEIAQDATDFRMMKRQVVDAIISLPERERFTKGIYSWVGFKTEYIEFEIAERSEGHSSWSFRSLLHYAVVGITAFSTVPLKIATFIGLLFAGIAVAYSVYVFFETLIYGSRTAGFPTTIILMLLIGGIIITLLGVIGEYIARIFEEVKQRPHYIIRESNTDFKRK